MIVKELNLEELKALFLGGSDAVYDVIHSVLGSKVMIYDPKQLLCAEETIFEWKYPSGRTIQLFTKPFPES